MFRSLILLTLPLFVYSLPTIRIGERCGPKDLHSDLSKDLAYNLAMDLARSADFIFKNLGLSKEQIIKFALVGSKINLNYEERTRVIANIFQPSFKAERNYVMFSAKFEANRIERWARDLSLIDMDASKTIAIAMSMPWKREKLWETLDLEGRRELIYQEMKKDLCS